MLKTLSQLLELRRATLTADELADWSEEALGFLVEQKVVAPARPATHVACDACHDDHVEEVTPIKSGAHIVFRIPCPEAGWVDVPEARLWQWTVDVGRLMDVLANAFSPDHPPDELMRRLAWRLGAIEVAGQVYDVVFVRMNDITGEDLLRELAGKQPPAHTIVIGTGDLSDNPYGFAASVPLASAFMFTGGVLAIQLDRIRSVVSAQTVVAGNVFQLRGDFWQVSFDGKTVFLKDAVGMGYIARLLAEPNREIPAVTLLAVRAGIDPLVASGSSGEVLDDQARNEYGRRYRELQDELQEARENHDLGRIEQLELAMDQLTKELASATGLGGRSRKKSDIERVRKQVSMAVARGMAKIGEVHEALGRHLVDKITSGVTFRYSMDGDMNWQT